MDINIEEFVTTLLKRRFAAKGIDYDSFDKELVAKMRMQLILSIGDEMQKEIVASMSKEKIEKFVALASDQDRQDEIAGFLKINAPSLEKNISEMLVRFAEQYMQEG